MSGEIIHFDFSQPKPALVLNHNMVLFEQNSSSSIEIKPKANNENDVILQLNNSDGGPGAQGEN